MRVSIICCPAQNEGPPYSRALHTLRISTQYYQHSVRVLRTVTQASSASSEDLRTMEPARSEGRDIERPAPSEDLRTVASWKPIKNF